MSFRVLISALLLAILARSPALAQIQQQVVTGYMTTSGCPSAALTPCFVQYGAGGSGPGSNVNLTQVGGAAIALGAATPATSLPVVLPIATPAAGTASAIVTGGSAVTLITGPVNGCYVTNPLTAADQNIATAEVAQVNPVTTATANGRGTNSTLQPGQGYSCPSGMTTNLSAIAATTAHAFNVVKW